MRANPKIVSYVSHSLDNHPIYWEIYPIQRKNFAYVFGYLSAIHKYPFSYRDGATKAEFSCLSDALIFMLAKESNR
jgi:hypothetical protein